MDTLFGEDFSFQGYVTGKLSPYVPRALDVVSGTVGRHAVQCWTTPTSPSSLRKRARGGSTLRAVKVATRIFARITQRCALKTSSTERRECSR